MNIPSKFTQHGKHPVVRNVGQLKAALNELPDDLPVSDGWGRAPEVIVYNRGQPDMHMQLHERSDE